MTIPRGTNFSGSISSRIVYELLPTSPSQTYCLSNLALLDDTKTLLIMIIYDVYHNAHENCEGLSGRVRGAQKRLRRDAKPQA